MSYHVSYEIGFLDLAAGFMKDDPAGIAELLITLDLLEADPKPKTSFPYGSTGIRRLRADRYRVLYAIDEGSGTIRVDHLARVP